MAKIKKYSELAQLSYDVLKGQVKKYSNNQAEDAIRQALLDSVGGEWTYQNFRRHKIELYEVLEEVMTPVMGIILTDQLGRFVDVQEVDLNEKKKFIFTDPKLFTVGLVAAGNNDLSRQTIGNGSFEVETARYGIKIYTELELFISGIINWVELKDRVVKSFAAAIGGRIGEALFKGFDYAAPNKDFNKDGTFSEDVLMDLIENVQIHTGSSPVIFGSKKALSKIKGAENLYSDGMKNDLNLFGHLRHFQNTPMLEIPQALGADGKKVIPSDKIIVVPNNEKVVKLVLEGDVIIYDTEAGQRNDDQIEFLFTRKFGVGVARPSIYGTYAFK